MDIAALRRKERQRLDGDKRFFVALDDTHPNRTSGSGIVYSKV